MHAFYAIHVSHCVTDTLPHCLRCRWKPEETEDYHHGQTAGCPTQRIQPKLEALTARSRAALAGDRSRHACHSSVVPEPPRQRQENEEGRGPAGHH